MKLLLVEDDEEAADYLKRALIEAGHAVDHAAAGRDGLFQAAGDAYDVIILDRMLPELDGLAILRTIRAARVRTPVLLLTALDGIAQRVEGLDAGADDYLVKPFAFSELVARLNALMRRPPINDGIGRLEAGDITVDLLRREVTRAGRVLLLQPREFAMLEQLMRNAGRVVTRTMFLEQVWGFHFDPQTNIVESNLSRLRAKLREGFSDDPIETVRGSGYRMRASA
jgi:two-component system OmpR family response regulator